MNLQTFERAKGLVAQIKDYQYALACFEAPYSFEDGSVVSFNPAIMIEFDNWEDDDLIRTVTRLPGC